MRDDEVYRLQKQVKRLYRLVQRVQPVVEGLSYSALQVLVVVEQADRALRPGGLAAELQMTSSNVAAALRSLEIEGLVVRESDPVEGRKALVSFTRPGAKVITEARRDNHAWLQQAIAGALTSDEQRLLLRAGVGQGRVHRGAGHGCPATWPAQRRVVRGTVGVPAWRVGGPAERPAQVRRVLDPARPQVDQRDGPDGQRGRRGHEAEAGSGRRHRRLRPVVVGDGEHLFGETSGIKPFRLTGSRTIGNGLALLTYEIVRDA